MLWRANRFQTRGTLSLHDVLKNSDGKLSNQDQGKLFTQVQADRNACKIFMEQIIQSAIFGSQGLSISVVSKYVEQEKNYERNKQMFYINDNNKKESNMVRNIDH